MMIARRLFALAPLLAVLACNSGGNAKSGGPPPLDTSKPDDALLAQALAHYDAANLLATSARAKPPGSERDGLTTQAVGEYDAAISIFASLPMQFPSSIRRDQAAYLEGRSHYEVGALTNSAARFEIARDHLDAAEAAFNPSYFRDGMTYFDGRARFQLAAMHLVAPGVSSAAIRSEFEGARGDFELSLAANAKGTWSDNSTYYRGRCDYEIGFVYEHPVEPGATAPTPGTAEFLDDVARFDKAKIELAAVPSGSTSADNARYYLGRSYFEAPLDKGLTGFATLRVAALDTAISHFTAVLGLGTASIYAEDARYWRGRSYYSREVYEVGPVSKDSDLALAATDFRSIPATQHYRDNALYDLAKCYLKFQATGTAPDITTPYCKTLNPRPGDPDPASACAAKAALDALVGAPASVFASSTYPGLLDTYLAAATPACSCP